jgi:large subunit ribosomal protein L13
LTAIIPEPLGLPRGFSLMKTYVAKPTERERNWLVVDAEGQTLGRLATRIADALRGKRKPEYTPHVDTGDFVVVVNAEKVHLTGKKWSDKIYYKHSQYPGGMTERTAGDIRAKHPTRLIEGAVRGMLPVNRLRANRLKRLRVFVGADHGHAAQQPKELKTD